MGTSNIYPIHLKTRIRVILDKDHLDKGHLVKGHLVTIYTNKESPISVACLLCYSNIVLVI